MAQRLGGLYTILRLPWAYSAFQRAIVRGDPQRLIADRYIRPRPGDRVVDVGCGLGEILEYLGDVEYTGIDLDAGYIESARRRYGSRGEFIHGRAEEAVARLSGRADIVLAKALLHHLDDTQAAAFLHAAAALLQPHGRLITSDHVYLSPQHRVARLLIALDRGKNGRARDHYVALAKGSFDNVESFLHHDFLRVPYDHCIMVCSKPAVARDAHVRVRNAEMRTGDC